jgi:hypothetical protein
VLVDTEDSEGPRSLREYVDRLIDFLQRTADERGRHLPEWKCVLISEDEGATGSPSAGWTHIEDSQQRFTDALERSTRDWVNLVVDRVEDQNLYVVIEYLTSTVHAVYIPASRKSVNLSGPRLVWLEALPKLP